MIYEVQLKRVQVISVWVEADTQDQAIDDGLELVYDVADWADISYDAQASETVMERVWDRYWSGGPEGNWISV
jgi:hypothetical protein